ncbi:MAG: bifunctional UDP-N-acetylglucosamine diphosphorylase/glucosamine-1-phosphate N-acetyltransferase GlmU [Alphaproteobacteria bacterium]|nr:bifunctional UDP-N-acetylglucosamine diphosphorylase/glucosamine-1-phosphate N-acetyltransferase GlmU [Alphaproteobacteria bacterium]
MKKSLAIILAAGLGTRMKSSKPKVMHEIAGRSMLANIIDTLENKVKFDEIVVVTGDDTPEIIEEASPHKTSIQKNRLGTAHAVLAAKEHIKNFDGNVFVFFGDTPLITAKTIKKMQDVMNSSSSPAAVFLGFIPKDTAKYGRFVTNKDELEAIVEHTDATDEQREITLCNSGVATIDGKHALNLLELVDNNNAKGEYYLTDIVAIAKNSGLKCSYAIGEEEEFLGINSRHELAEAEQIVQKNLRKQAMDNGATLLAPETTFFSYDTKIGKDVIIEPNVFFGKGVNVGNNVRIKAFSHIEGANIEGSSDIGPFARLRPGAEIRETARIGNFVEVKKATIEKGAKVNHLTYIGDARVGEKANIGAGTITCNYDGYNKSFTDIGAGSFIGSNSALVAPVKIGDGAIIGAGSTITHEVDKDALSVTRSKIRTIKGWATKFRRLNERNKKY